MSDIAKGVSHLFASIVEIIKGIFSTVFHVFEGALNAVIGLFKSVFNLAEGVVGFIIGMPSTCSSGDSRGEADCDREPLHHWNAVCRLFRVRLISTTSGQTARPDLESRDGQEQMKKNAIERSTGWGEIWGTTRIEMRRDGFRDARAMIILQT